MKASASTAPPQAAELQDFFMEAAPKVAGVLAILVVGLIISAIASRATRWIIEKLGIDALAEKIGISKLLYGVGIKAGVPQVLGKIVWYTGVLLTLAAVTESMGLPGVAVGIAVLISYIPRLFAAGLILLGGFLLADFSKKFINAIMKKKGEAGNPSVGLAVYYLLLILSGTMAADHLGFETRLINSIIETGIQAALFGLALAFALGAKGTFSHVVARFYAERLYRPGDRIRVGDVEGTVISFGAAQVLIEADDKTEIIVPAQTLMDAVVGIQRVETLKTETDPGEVEPSNDD